jgi:hypothetical protein
MVLPYLKGFLLIKCGFLYLVLWIYCVFSICGDYIGISIQVLNKLSIQRSFVLPMYLCLLLHLHC